MAATLDDLVYVATALRQDVREKLDKIIDHMEHPQTGSGAGAPAGGGKGAGGSGGSGDYLDQIWAWVKKVSSQSGAVQDTFRGLYDSLTKLAAPIGNAVSILGKVRDAHVSAFDKVGAGAAKAGQVLGSFADTFQKVLGALGGGMAKFVQLANPGAVSRFNWAMENAMSAMGRIFAPALEKVTAMVQAIGNAIESLSPQAKKLIAGLGAGAGLAGAFAAVASAVSLALSALGGPVTLLIALGSAIAGVAVASGNGKRVMEAFGGILKLLGGFFEQLAGELLPVIEDLMPSIMEALGAWLKAVAAVDGLILSVLAVAVREVLVPVLQLLATVVTHVATAIVGAVNVMRKALGLPLGRSATDYDPGKNTAAAARQASFGDLRGLANRHYASVYNSTMTSTAQRQLSEAERQTAILNRIAGNTDRDGGENSASLPPISGAALLSRMARALR